MSPRVYLPRSRYATTGKILLFRDIGDTTTDCSIDYKSMAVLNNIQAQSPDINQGLMFGFTCSETSELMPATLPASSQDGFP